MPKLPDPLTARVGGGQLDVSASAESFGAAQGRAMEYAGGQMMKAADTMKTLQENDELRKVQLEAARIQTEYNQALEEARMSGASINDVEAKYQERLLDLDQLGTTTKARSAAKLAIQQGKRLFFDSANKIRVQQYADAATKDYIDLIELAGNSLGNRPDEVDEWQARLDAAIDTYGLPPEKKELLKQKAYQELDMIAAERFIEIDPGFAIEELKRGAWDHLPGDKRPALIAKAQNEIEARERLQWAREAHERMLEDEENKKHFSQGVTDIIQATEMGKFDSAVNTILRNPKLDGGQKITLVNFAESFAKGEGKTDHGIMNNLFRRIMLPYGDPEKITDPSEIVAYKAAGKLSRTDFDWLYGLWSDDNSPEGRAFNTEAKDLVQMVQKRVDDSTMMSNDPDGAANFADWHREFMRTVDEYRKGGKDPRKLLDPSSPEYAGNWLSAQRRSGVRVMKDQAAAMKLKIDKLAEPIDPLDPSTFIPLISNDKGLAQIPPGTAFRYRDPETGEIKTRVKLRDPVKKTEGEK